ncbi:MAG: hypothetical protein EU551_00490 [Promethearchaeota archaeon]|nr:MAG: hypothetical protein EU551_00490 [Candidatus Lokiarchaeota archaeon]
MKFFRAEFQIITGIIHNNQYISGHYFHRWFDHPTKALGIIVDRNKWEKSDPSDYFSPYSLPAHYSYEYFNSTSRVSNRRPVSFNSRRVYGIQNILLMDILEPTTEVMQNFKEKVLSKRKFQFGGRQNDCNGICRYRKGNFYQFEPDIPKDNEFLIKFISDYIPKKMDNMNNILDNELDKKSIELEILSIPEIEIKKYYIKNVALHAIPQGFMIHCNAKSPRDKKILGRLGLRGIGQFKNAGYGKFILLRVEKSPLYHHGRYQPFVNSYSDLEKELLKAALLHDVIPKLGGIEFLEEYLNENNTIWGNLLHLHYQWHKLREKSDISLVKFVKKIEKEHDKTLSEYYYKLSLADQLAASLTRTNIRQTYSRYVINTDKGNSIVKGEKIDFLGLSNQLINIESVFKLWKNIIKSRELAMLNEALYYGDQPLSTHLLLTMAFMSHLIRGKPAFVISNITPKNQKKFIEKYWYKIFNITEKKEVFIYVIEEKVPEYPSDLVEKVLVKSIRPETGWLRIQ